MHQAHLWSIEPSTLGYWPSFVVISLRAGQYNAPQTYFLSLSQFACQWLASRHPFWPGWSDVWAHLVSLLLNEVRCTVNCCQIQQAEIGGNILIARNIRHHNPRWIPWHCEDPFVVPVTLEVGASTHVWSFFRLLGIIHRQPGTVDDYFALSVCMPVVAANRIGMHSSYSLDVREKPLQLIKHTLSKASLPKTALGTLSGVRWRQIEQNIFAEGAGQAD